MLWPKGFSVVGIFLSRRKNLKDHNGFFFDFKEFILTKDKEIIDHNNIMLKQNKPN